MDNILTALEQDCAVEQSNLHQSNLLYQQSQFSQQHQRMISQQLNIQSMNHSSLAISQQHSQQLSRQQNFNILLDKTLPQHKHKMELLLEKLKNKEIDTESFGAEAKLYMEPPSNKKVSQNKVTVQQNQNQNTILKRTRSASGLNSSSSTSDLHQSKRIKQNDYQLQQQQILILKQKQLSFNVNPSSPQPSLPATPKQPEVEVENLMEISNFGGFNEKDEEDALYQTDYTHVREMPNGYDPNIDRIRVQNFMNIVGLKKMIQNIASSNSIKKVDDDALNYIGLACQDRLRGIVEKMVKASKHRKGINYQKFIKEEEKSLATSILLDNSKKQKVLVTLTSQPKKRMAELEKMEKDEERRLRVANGFGGIQGEEDFNGSTAGGFPDMSNVDDEEDGGKKKKKKGKKADQPEHIKTANANSRALTAFGGELKSWMVPKGQFDDPTLIAPKKKNKNKDNSPKSGGSSPSSSLIGSGAVGGHLQQQQLQQLLQQNKSISELNTPLYASNGEQISKIMLDRDLKRISLVDALFTLERDDNLKNSNVLYKWFLNLK